jgi:hypothetical protein
MCVRGSDSSAVVRYSAKVLGGHAEATRLISDVDGAAAEAYHRPKRRAGGPSLKARTNLLQHQCLPARIRRGARKVLQAFKKRSVGDDDGVDEHTIEIAQVGTLAKMFRQRWFPRYLVHEHMRSSVSRVWHQVKNILRRGE